jgi:hypothetical protein
MLASSAPSIATRIAPCVRHAVPQAMHIHTNILTNTYSPTELTHVGERAGTRTDISFDQGGIPVMNDVLVALAPFIGVKTERYPNAFRTDTRKPIPQKDRIFVYQRDNFRCCWCGADSPLELDHILPWSAGGCDCVDNLRTLCGPCNHRRSNWRRWDDGLLPLPVTYWCVNCPDDPWPVSDYRTGRSFCWWCRMAGLGAVSRPR